MKARLPQGFGGGPSNMNGMLKQAQKMQEVMYRVSEELEALDYSATVGGGAVSVTVTGSMEVKSVDMKPEVVDPEDIEMLSDLIIAAVNEALRKAEDEKNSRVESITGGITLPGIF